MSFLQGSQEPSQSLEQSTQCGLEGQDGKTVNLFHNPTSLLCKTIGYATV